MRNTIPRVKSVLPQFQERNCVGSRFANEKFVGTGIGCCTCPGHVEIDERPLIPVCFSRREESDGN